MTHYIEKSYCIEEVLPGMILGEDISDRSGKIILSRGAILTDRLIKLLDNWNIPQITVREKAAEPINNYNIQAVEKLESFKRSYNEAVTLIKQVFDSAKNKKEIPLKDLLDLADNRVYSFIDEPGIFNHLYQIERKESYLYHHSIDVSIISGILAKWIELPNQEVIDIVLAGLLHDIGKVIIPNEILDKRGKLTAEEQETIKLHSAYGSKLIKKHKYISNKVNLAVLQHHERSDGSGYPLKATTENIYLPAKLIGIADVYGAITSNRVYKQRVSPFDAVGIIEDMMGSLDISISMIFLNNLKDCFIGNNVMLSDGRKAKVIYWSKFKHARPIVQTADGECFALEKTQVNIVDILG